MFYSRLARCAAAAAAICALASCAGTAVPVRSYGYDTDTKKRVVSDTVSPLSSRDRAAHLLREWDMSLQGIQGANTAANTALPALAGLVGLRAARNKASAPTAALAAVGLVGMSISDAMIQLSRMNVYIEGIAALECAVVHYDAVGLESVRANLSGAREYTISEPLLAAYNDFSAAFATVNRPLEVALGQAVSRVAHDTNRALVGSIVSVQSRPVGGAFTTALQAPPPTPTTIKRIEDAVSQKNINAKPSVQDTLESELVDAYRELISKRLVAIDEAVAEINKCNFGGGVTSSVETRPATLSLRAENFEGKPVELKKGATTRIFITGGLPDYSVQLHPDTATQLSQVYLKVAGAHVVEVTAVNATEATEDYALYVSDASSPKSTVVLPIRIVP